VGTIVTTPSGHFKMARLDAHEVQVPVAVSQGVVDRMLAGHSFEHEAAAGGEVDGQRKDLGRLVEAHAAHRPRRGDVQRRFEQPVKHAYRSCSTWPMRQDAASAMTASLPAEARRQGFAAPGFARP
jgi:hypothetical protein